jgi:hypothetical protein
MANERAEDKSLRITMLYPQYKKVRYTHQTPKGWAHEYFLFLKNRGELDIAGSFHSGITDSPYGFSHARQESEKSINYPLI